jgi:membrane fusion protein, multidrug efflux system
MTRTGRIAFSLVCLTLAAGIIYYWAPWQSSPQQTVVNKKGKGKRGFGAATPGEAVPVLAVAAKVADVPVYLDGVGTARALNTVTVRAQVDGKLLSLSFTEGQEVPKGFLLAKIDPATYQALYDQAVAKKAQDEATLANAKLDLERYLRLAASNAVNKQQLDTQRALVAQLEAQVRSDQAAIDNARTILSYTDIIAPIAGRTGIRLVDEGNLVRGSDTTGIVVITQLRPITVLFNLPQQELPQLSKGLSEGPLPLDALGQNGKPIDKGKLLVIDNQVDQTTGTVKLKAEFPNENLQLWPGQFVNVRLKVETIEKAIVVPTAAVQRGPVGTFSYVIGEDNMVTAKPVSVTQQNENDAVIASGLSPSDHVVTTGFANLSDGARVTVGNNDQLPSADLAPRKRGNRGPREQGKDGEPGKREGKGEGKRSEGKNLEGKNFEAKSSQGKNGEDGERRRRRGEERSQGEGDEKGQIGPAPAPPSTAPPPKASP